MKVEIFIVSKGYGQTLSCEAEGDLAINDGGFALAYSLEGDECSLIYDGLSIRQSRKGKLTYSVKFIPYTKCFFEFSESGLFFNREINVYKSEAAVNNDGCTISITYTDCGSVTPDDGVELFFSAKYIK